jgi:hypothetical protein
VGLTFSSLAPGKLPFLLHGGHSRRIRCPRALFAAHVACAPVRSRRPWVEQAPPAGREVSSALESRMPIPARCRCPSLGPRSPARGVALAARSVGSGPRETALQVPGAQPQWISGRLHPSARRVPWVS